MYHVMLKCNEWCRHLIVDTVALSFTSISDLWNYMKFKHLIQLQYLNTIIIHVFFFYFHWVIYGSHKYCHFLYCIWLSLLHCIHEIADDLLLYVTGVSYEPSVVFMNGVSGATPKCPKCGRNVYFQEEKTIRGQKYHVQCVTCGKYM